MCLRYSLVPQSLEGIFLSPSLYIALALIFTYNLVSNLVWTNETHAIPASPFLTYSILHCFSCVLHSHLFLTHSVSLPLLLLLYPFLYPSIIPSFLPCSTFSLLFFFFSPFSLLNLLFHHFYFSTWFYFYFSGFKLWKANTLPKPVIINTYKHE